MTGARSKAAAFLSALLALGAARVARAADDTPQAPSMAGEKSSIKPVGERAIGKRERPTIKHREDKSARDKRATRVSLQIPERLRAVLAKKIDARISRDIAEEKQLRDKAHALLAKFIAETPPDSPEMPEALLRIGELEWETSRDQFLLDFHKWDKSPADKRGPPPNPDYSQSRKRFLRVLKNYKSYRDYDLALYVDGFLANEEGKSTRGGGSLQQDPRLVPGQPFRAGRAHVPRGVRVHQGRTRTTRLPTTSTRRSCSTRTASSTTSRSSRARGACGAWAAPTRPRGASSPSSRPRPKRARRAGKKRAEIDELQREALKNLVAVFVEDEKNTAEDMYKFLVKAGGAKFAGKIVHALANAFYDQAHYERGIEAYKLLLKLEPADPDGLRARALGGAGPLDHGGVEEARRTDYRWILHDYTVRRPAEGQAGRRAACGRARRRPRRIARAAERAIEKQLREDAVGLHAKAQADKAQPWPSSRARPGSTRRT